MSVSDSTRLSHYQQLFEQSPAFMALLEGPEHRIVLANSAYHQLIGGRDVVGMPVRKALPEIEGQGFFELLDNVFRSGRPFIGRNVEVWLLRSSRGQPERRRVDFVYQPIRDTQDA